MTGWKRTYWAVFGANLVTAIGMMSFLPFFPSYLEELGLRDRGEIAFWTGLIFGAAPLAAALMSPIWGSIGDRFGRKAMVLRSMLAIMLFVGLMGLAQSPWQLFGLRLCQGVFSGFVPPSITLVSVSAPRGLQGRVASTLQSALAAGAIIGPIVGAFIQSHYGSRFVFAFVALASGFAALMVALFAREDHSMRATLERWSPLMVLTGTWSDLRDLLANPRIRAGVLVLFVVQFGVGATNPLLELLVRDLGFEDGAVAGRTGLLFTATAAAGLVATPVWGWVGDTFGHPRALLGSALASALVLALHGWAAAFVVLVVARLFVGLAASGPSAATFALAATETAPERRGNALGAAFSARALAVSLGAMGGGALATVVGIRGLFWCSAAAVLLGTLACSGSLRRGQAQSVAVVEADDHIL